MEHPITETELRRFAVGAANREERLAVLSHLLRGCPACVAPLRALALPKPLPPAAYDAVFGRLEGFLPDGLDPDDPLSLGFLTDMPVGPLPGESRRAAARRY